MAKNVKIFIIVSLFGLFFLSQSCFAIGVGLKPKELKIRTQTDQSETADFLVVNISAEPAIYQIFPDEFGDQIKVTPSDFRLEPDGSQIVRVSAKFKKPGEFMTQISVIARPLAVANLVAATGVKMPIYVSVEGKSRLILMGIFIVLACLFAILAVKLISRR
jgi:hypothetical protein